VEPFLAPVEKPKGLMLKMAYYFARRQFGKVPTPMKVFYPRMPAAFGLFAAKISKLDKKLLLPPETAMLIREQVARINVCLFCMDIGRSFVIKASMNEVKFDALDQHSTSSLFSDAERSALDYVTELTRDKKVAPSTFARVSGTGRGISD
jgi:alkylhydroperoxidase family enzyme